MKIISHSGKRMLTLVRFAVLSIGTVLVLSMLTSTAFAKNKVYKGANGMLQLELCRSKVDTKKNPNDQIENDKFSNSCCSKEYGYCIDCPKATPDTCTRYPYFMHSKLPTAPKNDVLAPTDKKPKSRTPRFNNSTGTRAR